MIRKLKEQQAGHLRIFVQKRSSFLTLPTSVCAAVPVGYTKETEFTYQDIEEDGESKIGYR